MSLCKYGCGKEIYWNQDGPPWIPHEDEALTKVHDCPKRPPQQAETKSAPPPAKPKPTPLDDSPARKPLEKVPPLNDEELNFFHKFYHFCTMNRKELAPK